VKLGAAVFAALHRLHSAAEDVGNPLHAVADTKNRNSGAQDRGITFRSVPVVDRIWTAREHDAGGFERSNFGDAGGTRKDGAKNLLLARTTTPPNSDFGLAFSFCIFTPVWDTVCVSGIAVSPSPEKRQTTTFRQPRDSATCLAHRLL
jgi:hypothetical protein